MADEIRRLSDDLARDPSSLVFMPLADALRRAGQLDVALRVALRGLDRHPYVADAHDVLARIHADRGDRRARCGRVGDGAAPRPVARAGEPRARLRRLSPRQPRERGASALRGRRRGAAPGRRGGAGARAWRAEHRGVERLRRSRQPNVRGCPMSDAPHAGVAVARRRRASRPAPRSVAGGPGVSHA